MDLVIALVWIGALLFFLPWIISGVLILIVGFVVIVMFLWMLLTGR